MCPKQAGPASEISRNPTPGSLAQTSHSADSGLRECGCLRQGAATAPTKQLGHKFPKSLAPPPGSFPGNIPARSKVSWAGKNKSYKGWGNREGSTCCSGWRPGEAGESHPGQVGSSIWEGLSSSGFPGAPQALQELPSPTGCSLLEEGEKSKLGLFGTGLRTHRENKDKPDFFLQLPELTEF